MPKQIDPQLDALAKKLKLHTHAKDVGFPCDARYMAYGCENYIIARGLYGSTPLYKFVRSKGESKELSHVEKLEYTISELELRATGYKPHKYTPPDLGRLRKEFEATLVKYGFTYKKENFGTSWSKGDMTAWLQHTQASIHDKATTAHYIGKVSGMTAWLDNYAKQGIHDPVLTSILARANFAPDVEDSLTVNRYVHNSGRVNIKVADAMLGTDKALEVSLATSYVTRAYVRINDILANPKPFEDMLTGLSAYWDEVALLSDRLNTAVCVRFPTSKVATEAEAYGEQDILCVKIDQGASRMTIAVRSNKKCTVSMGGSVEEVLAFAAMARDAEDIVQHWELPPAKRVYATNPYEEAK